MSGLFVDIELPEGIRSEQTPDGLVLTVLERTMFEPLIPVSVRARDAKLRVSVGVGSRVRFVLDYEYQAGLEASFELENGAYMDLFHLDCQQRDDKLVSRNNYQLKKHASLNVWTFAAGSGADIRHDVKFLEPHGFAAVRGLSLLGENADVTHRVTADHSVGQCASRQFYKSILSGHARSAFESLVRVAKGADKSDSRQLNKNLLLSKDAKAVSRPELRIDADDVSCAHGSATGELSEDEIFYLRSRGIEHRLARLLMTEGFAGEILEDIPIDFLKEELHELVQAKITELVKAEA